MAVRRATRACMTRFIRQAGAALAIVVTAAHVSAQTPSRSGTPASSATNGLHRSSAQAATISDVQPPMVPTVGIGSLSPVRVKDVAALQGVQPVPLVGYGLVIGLNKSGDK